MARKIERIFHATDYSKASGRALDEAVGLAQQHKAELVVVHVIEPVGQYAVGEDFGGAELYVKLEEAAKQDAQRSMEKLMARLKKLGVKKVSSLLLKGIAHEQIVKAAKSRRADMIVIGTHGRTGLSKLFMGSVASRVISAAACPVVTVRGK